jgi:hypothetical protein
VSGGLRFQSDPVVDWVAQALLATKIAPSSLNRHMSEQELDLFEFTSRLVAEPGARPAEIVRGDRSEAAVGGGFPNDRPDHLCCER